MTSLLLQIRLKIEKNVSIFEVTDLKPSVSWKEGLQTSAYWIVPSVFYVFCLDWLGKFRTTTYLKKAMEQGISPELWNVIGVLGFFLVGISVFTAKAERSHKLFAKTAHRVLLIAFEIGLLAFGLLLGEVVLGFKKIQLLIWQVWFFGVSFFVLFIVFLALNSALWYLAHIIYNPNKIAPIMSKIAQCNVFVKVVVGLFFMILPVCFLLMKR